MSERYRKLYSLEHRLYSSHAPVIIESGALLLEQRCHAFLCQICFRNIQDKPIRSLRAEVQMLDKDGMPLGKPLDHRYQDMELKREEDCGRDVAIVLPSPLAASFSVRVSQVVFSDGEVWTDEGAPWEPLADQDALEERYSRTGDLNRFLNRFGQDCSFAPLETEELWFCACGAVNANADSRCHRCGRRRSALLGKGAEALSPEEQEEASFHAASYPEPPSPWPVRWIIAGASLLLLAVIVGLLMLPRLKSSMQESRVKETQQQQNLAAEELPVSGEQPHDKQEEAYRKALELQVRADNASLEEAAALYEEAAASFEALGEYEDSRERAEVCRSAPEKRREAQLEADYWSAVVLLETGDYAKARAAFLALGDYQDSADQAKEAVYRKALALYRYVDENDIRGLTALLSADTEKESVVVVSEAQMLRMGSGGFEKLKACFGKDPVRFTAEDPAEEPLQPLPLAIIPLLRPLGDYRNSAELSAQLPEMVDRSEEFFILCGAGELEAARDWLEAWEKPFDDRELWLERVERFLPFCGDWTMRAGDPSLVSQMLDSGEKIYDLRCKVLLRRDEAVLLVLLHEGDTTGPELSTELDGSQFVLYTDRGDYVMQLVPSGSLTLNKYQGGSGVGGVEYVR